MKLIPFFREVGSGPAVVCLHANASSSSQWRPLMDLLAPKFHVLAPDLYGAGQNCGWPRDRSVSLHDEVQLLEPIFARAREPFALVGHSYGAAVALIAALARRDQISAMALYEPTLFALVDAESPPPNDADGIREVISKATAAIEAGQPASAAECFIDYWMSSGTWAQMPEPRKAFITSGIANIRSWASALLEESTSLKSFAALSIPVLFMIGKHSPPSSLAVAKLLVTTLPRVEVIEFEELGHMGPVTHPAMVNEAIARFLGRK